MAIAILGDCHFGAHNSSIPHHENMKKFFRDFFEYIDTHNIRYILQLGDLFDVRKHTNTWSLNLFRQTFLEQILKRDLHCTVILGNHDIYYRETLEVSSVEETLLPYPDKFTIVKHADDYIIDNESFLLVPWICKANQEHTMAKIKNSKSRRCAGHFAFSGFEILKGHLAKNGHDHLLYEQFDAVYSGHYHAMSNKNNVLYTGTPYQLDWSDCGVSKGFFVLEDGDIQFVENSHTLYSDITLSEHEIILPELVASKFVKLRIDKELSAKERDLLLDRLNKMNPQTLTVIDRRIDVSVNTKAYNHNTSIPDMMKDYIENISLPDNVTPDRLSHIMLDIYSQAMSSCK